MKVVDDFLPSYQFKEIQSLLMGPEFPWYYNDHICDEGDGLFQDKHTFYNRKSGMTSDYLSLFDYCLNRLGVKELWRMLMPIQDLLKIYYHTDCFPCPYTAVYYINTNNGYTKFKKVVK